MQKIEILKNSGSAVASLYLVTNKNRTFARVMHPYFFHSDHLGSTSYLTDKSGEVSQHVEYFPFGGVMVDERHWAVENQYLFNGKELDEETGLYYYGARYYDPKISMWYGVDPLAEKYPFSSPYAYFINNPVILVDPDGRGIINGDEDIRDKAQAEMNKAKSEFEGKYNSTEMKRKKFSDKTKWRSYKESRNNLKDKVEYQELGVEYLQELKKDKQAKRYLKGLKDLGYKVELEKAS